MLTKIVNHSIVYSLLVAMGVLLVTSVIVRDYDFIVKHPIAFTIEMVMFSMIISLLIIVVFAKTRHMNVKNSVIWFVALFFKFSIFHVLFQLSGVYSVMFAK